MAKTVAWGRLRWGKCVDTVSSHCDTVSRQDISFLRILRLILCILSERVSRCLFASFFPFFQKPTPESPRPPCPSWCRPLAPAGMLKCAGSVHMEFLSETGKVVSYMTFRTAAYLEGKPTKGQQPAGKAEANRREVVMCSASSLCMMRLDNCQTRVPV